MKQRGFGIIIYVIAIAAVAAAFLGYGQYRYGQGVDKERTRNLNAVLEHEAKMSTERRKHNEELDKIAKQYAASTETANRKIRDLLSTNKVLADWWNAPIPADASDFIWLRPPSDNPVRGESVTDTGIASPNKTGTPN